jgi:hypothetical protein
MEEMWATSAASDNDYDTFAAVYAAGGSSFPVAGWSSRFPAAYADLCRNPRFLFFRLLAP